jgi:hypothetical protein
MKLPPELKAMLEALRDQVASPERKEIVVALAADLAQLTSRAIAGEDVSAELQHVKAQGELLAASEAALVNNALTDWIGLVTTAIVRGALAAI